MSRSTPAARRVLLLDRRRHFARRGRELNRHRSRTRARRIISHHTENYWRAWVKKNEIDLCGLLGRRSSIFTNVRCSSCNTQIDDGGAILAANDSDVTERATDHYSYLWTRDGAFVANALDLAGYAEMTRKFFDLCCRIVHQKGYFLQKYNPDGTVASGWHAVVGRARQRASWCRSRKTRRPSCCGRCGSITTDIATSILPPAVSNK